MKNMQNMKIGNKIIKVLIVERQKPHKKVEERRRSRSMAGIRSRSMAGIIKSRHDGRL
jgi:hypothetical protein